MSAVNQVAPEVSRKSYTAVGSFGLAFFKYSYSMNPRTLVEEGVLTAYGTEADCPVGRVLYENGKKIVPVQGGFSPIKTVSPVTGSENVRVNVIGEPLVIVPVGVTATATTANTGTCAGIMPP